MKRAVLLTLLIAGCASPPEQPSGAAWPWDSNTKAVSSLMASAHADAAAGRLANASATMERAIRLEPRNARLWQELAQLRLKQKDYVQAENMALRSNALMSASAGANAALRMGNWHLIAQAREARGDAEGARSARELAKRIGH